MTACRFGDAVDDELLTAGWDKLKVLGEEMPDIHDWQRKTKQLCFGIWDWASTGTWCGWIPKTEGDSC